MNEAWGAHDQSPRETALEWKTKGRNDVFSNLHFVQHRESFLLSLKGIEFQKEKITSAFSEKAELDIEYVTWLSSRLISSRRSCSSKPARLVILLWDRSSFCRVLKVSNPVIFSIWLELYKEKKTQKLWINKALQVENDIPEEEEGSLCYWEPHHK